MNPYATNRSPAHAPARVARNAAETVLLSVRDIPLQLDRPGVGERIRRAIDSLYATMDSDLDSPAHLDGLMEASSALSEARALLARASNDPARVPQLQRSLVILANAIAQLAPAAEQVAALQLERRMSLRRAPTVDETPKPRPFRASQGLPALHSLARPPLPVQVMLDPIIPLEAPPVATRPPHVTMEQLEAMAKAGAEGKPIKVPGMDDEEEADEPPPAPPIEYAYEPAVEEREVVRQLARFALEDIGNLSTLRHPIPTETWLDQGPFEQRLLNNLDYFASLGGPALAMVSLYHAESETPDLARAFAVAFALGCVEGSDAAYAAIATLKQSPPEEFPGWVEGWWLASSPAIDEALVDVLGHPKARLAGVAVDVLAARGSLPADAPEWLIQRGDVELTRKVARALGRCGPRDRALSLLEPLLRDETDDETLLVVIESALRRGASRAREMCRRIVLAGEGKRRDGAAFFLALCGHPDDAQTLFDVARAAPTARFARALGRYGHAAVVPLLITWLAAEDEALVPAAAEALDRITGAGLHEIVEEAWELQLPPEAREMEGIPKPMRKMRKVIKDPAPWTAWWQREHRRFDVRTKWRGGAPFSPMQIVDEIAAKETPTEHREEAALELVIATGVSTRFSPSDWVERQKQHIEDLRESVRSLAPAAGSWWFAGAATRGVVRPPV